MENKTYDTLIALVLLLPLLCYQGFVLATLWGWFVVPLGLAAIPWTQGAGLCLIAKLCGRKHSGTAECSLVQRAVLVAVAYSAILGLGYIFA